MWFLLAATAHAAPCDEPVPLDTFRTTLDLGWAEARRGEPEAARSHLVVLTQALGCLGARLAPEDAAAYHRNRALDARFAGDEVGARAAARVAARLAPEASDRWSSEVPAFGELLPQAAVPTVYEDFGTSLAATVVVDGAPVPRRFVGQPLIVQVFDPSGAPIRGAWVDGRAALPEWVAFPPVACPAPATVLDLLEQSARAEAAYVELDVAGFYAAMQAAAQGLPCITSRVSTQQAAAIHRLEGLRLYTLGAESAALRSFQQAQVLDPRYAPPESVVRPGSALSELWETAARAASSPWIATETPADVSLFVDGTPTSSRPAALPSIVQVTTRSGEVLWTRYVPSSVVLPDLTFLAVVARQREEAALPPGEAVYLDLSRRQARANRRTALVIGGVVALSGGAALFARNVRLAGDYGDPAVNPARLPELRRNVNQTAAGSSVLLGVGVGLLGVAFTLP